LTMQGKILKQGKLTGRQDMEFTVSNTSNGGTVSNLLYQTQAILRLAVSNTSNESPVTKVSVWDQVNHII